MKKVLKKVLTDKKYRNAEAVSMVVFSVALVAAPWRG